MGANTSSPIESRDALVRWMEATCKPESDWRIGTEHEKFVYTVDDFAPLPYEGEGERPGIVDVLNGYAEFGWQPIMEGNRLIALKKNGASITLEPGGQLELSGAPLETIHDTCAEVNGHLAETKKLAKDLGFGVLGMGFQPKWARDQIPWMPKGRYRIMGAHMPRVGSLGLDMMLRTCTVQVNLDYKSEADMVEKFRISLALQPIATALFANSPFTEGKLNGFQSYRSHIWTDTDPHRTGDLPFVFEDGFGFERYVDYLLNVPMYFVYRDGRYIDAAGQDFRDFMAGKLAAAPGEVATWADWDDQLTVSFPEVRLKKYLEMRGADGGPWKSLCALPALWVGLLYDATAQTAAYDLIKDWTQEERAQLRRDVPRMGLQTPFRGGTVQDIARQAVDIAYHGLIRRNRCDGWGRCETQFLEILQERSLTGRTAADILIEKFKGPWAGNVDAVFTEHAY